MGLTKPRAAQIFNLDYKQSTRVVTTTNITLTGGAPNSVDSVTLSLNDRVLVTGQTTASQNGLYLVTTLGSGSNGTWSRTTDGDQTGEIEAGMIVMVTEGVIYADTQWKLITDDPITIGVTALTFTQNYSANSISGGSSNVVVNSNANVTISSAGTANVVNVGNTAVTFTGNLFPSSNVTYSLGDTSLRWKDLWLSNSTLYIGDVTVATNGSALTVNGANVLVGNAGSAFSTSGNITGGNILTGGLISATGTITSANNITGGNIITAGSVSATGNITANGTITTEDTITGGNLATAGTVSAIGIVTGGNVLTGGVVSATGNITGNYFIGNGSQLTGLPATYGNANVATFLAEYGSNTISSTGTITAGNITGGNVLTGGDVSATGNISGNYILGNGALLTGVITSVANINNGTSNVTVVSSGGNVTVGVGGTGNVAVFATTGEYVSGLLSVTGNITSGNISATNITGTLTTASQTNITAVGILGSLSVSGNATVGNISATNYTGTDVSVTGTVTAASTVGGVITGTSTSVTGTQTAASTVGGVITGSSASVSGNITGNNILINGSAVITGNLNVQGTETIFNVANLTVNDKDIIVANNVTGGANVDGAGIQAGNPGVATWFFNNATTSWQSNIGITPTANGTLSLGGSNNYWGSAFVTSASITGNVTSGNLTTAGIVSATGNITGGNILGNGAGLSGINTFSNVTVTGGNSAVADSIADTLTLTAGTGITIVVDSTTDTITIAAQSGSGIFVDGADFGTVTEPVTLSDDLGLVTDAVTEEADLGTLVTSGLIYPDQFVLPSFTANALPSAVVAGAMIYVTNETGGAVPAFADGTNWRRVTDRAIVT